MTNRKSETPMLDHRIATAEGQQQAAERLRDKAWRKADELRDELMLANARIAELETELAGRDSLAEASE